MFDSDMKKIMLKYKNRIPRGRAIKIYCKEMCCAGDTKSWIDCDFNNCPLWRFRRGKEVLDEENPRTSKLNKKSDSIVSVSHQNNTLKKIKQEVE